jgi:hypothetical protein
MFLRNFGLPLNYTELHSRGLAAFTFSLVLILKKPPWSEPARDLHPLSDRRLSAKCLPTFADRGCHVVSVTDPYGRILGFLAQFQTHYFFLVVPGIEPGTPDL